MAKKQGTKQLKPFRKRRQSIASQFPKTEKFSELFAEEIILRDPEYAAVKTQALENLLAEKEDLSAVIELVTKHNAFNENQLIAKQKETIIKLRKANKEIKHLNQQLSELLDMKTGFIKLMTHCFNTPLNAIQNITYRLNERKRWMRFAVIRDLKTVLDRLTGVMRKVVVQGQLLSDQITVKKTPRSLDSLGRSLAWIAKRGIAKSKKRLTLSVLVKPSDLAGQLLVDAEMLGSIVQELIENSANALSDGGRIRLSLEMKKKIFVLRVSDNGPGIPSNEKANLFNPFNTPKNFSTARVTGARLGLAICAGFVRLLEGTISVSRAQKKGTTITIKLPVTLTEDKKPADRSGFMLNKKLSDCRILVCDDDYFNRQYMSMLLKQHCKLTLVDEAKKCPGLLRREKFDLVFMDIQMSGQDMDGIEAMKRCKKIRPTTPVIAFTAFPKEFDQKTLLKRGFDHYFFKPFVPATLKTFLAKEFGIQGTQKIS